MLSSTACDTCTRPPHSSSDVALTPQSILLLALDESDTISTPSSSISEPLDTRVQARNKAMVPVPQRFRPKHQVLILKCYPRAQKSTVETKPNSSELSYLLYYASTRRSKLQKVGAFLEKKTANDVYKLRQG